MMTTTTTTDAQISKAYDEVQVRESQIEDLRHRMNELCSDDLDFPPCLACGSSIEDKEAVGTVYHLESQIFKDESRDYLVCVWCKETILWNEIREEFLKHTKLPNFDLFGGDDDNDPEES